MKRGKRKDVPKTVSVMTFPANDEKYRVVPYEQEQNYDIRKDDTVSRRIYYISDIHIEHQIAKEFKDDLTAEDKYSHLQYLVNIRVREMLSFPQGQDDILLIGGDVASSVLVFSAFYKELYKYWHGGPIISILGNHELWDGTGPKEWEDPEYVPRKVKEIVKDYRNAISGKFYDTNNAKYGYCRTFESVLLENSLYIQYKGKGTKVLKGKEILKASKKELQSIFDKSSLIILGAIGFTGFNPEHNASLGIYRKTVSSWEEDQLRTMKFAKIYEKVRICAGLKRVIVLTHTPVHDWNKEQCQDNWIYVNGHTHINTVSINDGEAVLLSDNQVGYLPQKWKLNSFTMNITRYDPFEKYDDGIYEIAKKQYLEFNKGRGIMCEGCGYPGQIYMLKRSDKYMFLIKSASLCLLFGGQRKRLDKDIGYYYDNLPVYCECVDDFIKPYKEILQKLSDEIKIIGGTGKIHGSIVDISYFSHLYLDPYNGRITAYWARDTRTREEFNSVAGLLNKKEHSLIKRYKLEASNGLLPLIGDYNLCKENELVELPRTVLGTDMYKPSGILRAIQYIWEQDVVRIWNDDILNLSKPMISEKM